MRLFLYHAKIHPRRTLAPALASALFLIVLSVSLALAPGVAMEDQSILFDRLVESIW